MYFTPYDNPENALDFSDVIFDFGANTGEGIDYYLNRVSKVIAVEADPSLALVIRSRFEREIALGKLILVNKVLTNDDCGKVTFFLHKTNPGLNQFQEPSVEILGNFNPIELEAINVISLVNEFASKKSPPLYCKIDLEGFDTQILDALFKNEIFPINLSAECHDLEVALKIIATNEYEAYNLIEGPDVPKLKWVYNSKSGNQAIRQFAAFSAGPFGNDISKNWLTKTAILAQLYLYGPGWKDIHAVRSKSLLRHHLKDHLPIQLFVKGLLRKSYRSIFPYALRSLLWRLRQRNIIT